MTDVEKALAAVDEAMTLYDEVHALLSQDLQGVLSDVSHPLREVAEAICAVVERRLGRGETTKIRKAGQRTKTMPAVM